MASFRPAGAQFPGFQSQPMARPAPSPLRSVYDSAATTQAQDYDNIMSGYDSIQSRIQSSGNNNSINYVPSVATQIRDVPGYSYSRNADLGKLVGDLQGFSETGGYSGADIGNIRERGLSPLRAIYANATRNLNRQKNLQGGYMPNAGAITSKMAREQGELASTASTNINAEIAKMVQAGKLAGYSQLNPLLSQENTLQNTIGERNTQAQRDVTMANASEESRVRDLNATLKMRADEFNANQDRDDYSQELAALSGKSNLYGTTPALTSLFGNQVLQNNAQNLQAATTANQIKNARTGLGINLMSAADRSSYGMYGQ